jgi:hypothetical protein
MTGPIGTIDPINPNDPVDSMVCPQCGLNVREAEAVRAFIGEFGKRSRHLRVFHQGHYRQYLNANPAHDAVEMKRREQVAVDPKESG